MVAISEIQGRGHASPLLGEAVTAAGVVTALRTNGFYFQDPRGDGDPATSDGLFVFTRSAPSVSIGDRVEVSGSVGEFQPGGAASRNLTTTQIAADRVSVLESGVAPPDAIVLGENGRAVPSEVIDDDSFFSFDPEADAIDFYESLEGMRIAVEDAVAVGPTSRFGEIPVIADGADDAEDRTEAGGVYVSENDFNPERIHVDDAITRDPADVDVGDRFDGVIEGVLDYSFGNYKLLNTVELPAVIEGEAEQEVTHLSRDDDRLTIATFNVLNLDPRDDGSTAPSDDQLSRIAKQIVHNLDQPDIVALQEIQDNTGALDDGSVSARTTLVRLIEAIRAEGGESYSYAQISPENNADGGAPGGNIRVAYLYDHDRVSFADAPQGDATTPVEFGPDGLSLNPGRIDPENPAFEGSRKSLAAEFSFGGENVYVINNHFSSKFGSAPLFGDTQPATDATAFDREAQARVVRDAVEEVLAEDPGARIVVLGDFNEFEFRETHQILEDAGLTNKIDYVGAPDRYTFNFEGNSEVLDSIFVSPALASATEIDIVHANADFGQTTRGSDHDPIVARIDLGATPVQLVGRYAAGGDVNLEGGAEIPAFDAASQRLFVTNSADDAIDIVSIEDPANPSKVGAIDVARFGGGVNSVAAANGVIVAAFEAENPNDAGKLVFFDANGEPVGEAEAGVLPDQVTLTSDGRYAIAANEGEPTDEGDPEGSITIVDTHANYAATQLDFSAFVGQEDALRAEGVRIFEGRTAAEDFEPEYVSVSNDDTLALVTLQENNAIARIDLEHQRIVDVVGLGAKDHSAPGAGLDASDRDGGINIANHPVFGLYQPDAIDNFTVDGAEYFVIANEGDSRDEDERIEDLTLDPEAFPDAEELQKDENLGRLEVSTIDGDVDGDGDFDRLYSYGGRSFSVLDAHGNMVFDSGDALERIVANHTPAYHNSNGTQDSFDGRSDNKGPEPEGVVTFVAEGRPMAAIGLERAGGFVLYDLSNPTAPEFRGYVDAHDPSAPEGSLAAGDLSPEGLLWIDEANSPNGEGLLVVSNEFSGATSIYRLDDLQAPEPEETFELQILAASDLEGGVEAIENAPRFAALTEHFQEEADLPTLTISAGDNVIPGPFFNAATDDALSAELTEVYRDLFDNEALTVEGGQGRVDVTVMNILDFDASAVGNHDFDAGDRGFEGFVRPDGGYPGPEFPYLSANLEWEESRVGDLFTDRILETKQFSVQNGADPVKIADAAIAEKGGELIGIVGATTQLVETISSPGSVGVEGDGVVDMEALAQILQPVIDDVTARGVDKVVLVTHLQQLALEKELIGLLDDVDVVMAGGSDVLFADETDTLRPGDEAPEEAFPLVVETKSGAPAVIIGARGEYEYLARLVVEFDANGEVVVDSVDPNESGAYAAIDEVVAEVVGEPGDRAMQVAGLTDAIASVVSAADGAVFGATDVFLEGRREFVRTEETNLGNLSADANLAYARSIDPEVAVSLKNGGGIRAEIGTFGPNGELLAPEANPIAGKEEGEVSQLDIDNALRFNNGLSILNLTREGLLEIVEHGVAESGDGATPGRFPQVGGMAFSFDPDLPAGDRVVSLAVLNDDGSVADVIVENGELLGDPSAELKVVTLSFLADGGDGYPFEDLASDRVDLEQPEDAVRTGLAEFAVDGSEQDAIAELLAANFGETPFAQAETPAAEDQRIQNLDVRGTDTVLSGIAPVATAEPAADLDMLLASQV